MQVQADVEAAQQDVVRRMRERDEEADKAQRENKRAKSLEEQLQVRGGACNRGGAT